MDRNIDQNIKHLCLRKKQNIKSNGREQGIKEEFKRDKQRPKTLLSSYFKYQKKEQIHQYHGLIKADVER